MINGLPVSYGTLRIAPMPYLTFGSCGIQINLETGEVTIPEGLSLTEASREFWEAVSSLRKR
jgi:hypothetical protein